MADALPATVQHCYMVEFQSLGPMGGEQQQSGWPPPYFPAPFGQPLRKMTARQLRATGFQGVSSTASRNNSRQQPGTCPASHCWRVS
ncbi:hypothetical protein RZS08_53875, partial [Arthrospira platensis SPKY1]|nr:hypothetical protein [Arthrospira platensis SPKY1]